KGTESSGRRAARNLAGTSRGMRPSCGAPEAPLCASPALRGGGDTPPDGYCMLPPPPSAGRFRNCRGNSRKSVDMPDQSDGAAGSSADPQGGAAALGRYRIERTLGQGGVGEVLLALDTLLHRRVALKRLLPSGEGRAEQRSLILKEARRASQINDRHIAAIHDVLELDDQIVLVMEYVDGLTLRQRMAEPVSLDAFW